MAGTDAGVDAMAICHERSLEHRVPPAAQCLPLTRQNPQPIGNAVFCRDCVDFQKSREQTARLFSGTFRANHAEILLAQHVRSQRHCTPVRGVGDRLWRRGVNVR